MQKIAGLVCAGCHGALKPDGERALRCGTCGTTYPLISGIPSFVNKSVQPESLPGCALTVVIPALNEAANLDSLLPEVQRALKAIEPLHEVIVVDGGSTDGTQETVRKHGARLATQNLPGFGGALRAGFEQARGEYILTLDADGSHDASFIRDLWSARASGEVVIASRYIKGGSAEMPAWRFFLSRLLNTTFKRGLSLPVFDLSSGYRLYSRVALQQAQLKATDFDILEEILIRVLAAGYRVHEVPFQYKARRSGKSHARLIKFGISYSRTFAGMWRLRNSVASADYDSRAFDSIVPLQRYWQRHRHQILGRLSQGYGRILDVGCGSSRVLASNPAIVGLDIQLHKLRYARQFGNQLVHGSIFELPFPNESFDCVICSEVVEHIPAEEKPFDELFRVLRNGGRLILGTPDYDRWLWRALEWLYKRVSPGGYADEHITHYSRRNLSEYLKGKGFAVERVDYVGGCEMIFCLRKLGPMESSVPARSIQSALRDVSAA